jgi:hypothetical protein
MNEWVWSVGGMILTGKTEVLGEKHYTAWVVDEWMNMERWWNDTDRENWSTGRNTVPLLLCPHQIWHELTRDRTLASVVSDRRVTACDIARPLKLTPFIYKNILFVPHREQCLLSLWVKLFWLSCETQKQTASIRKERFWARSQNCENRLLASSCSFVRPSFWNNSAPTGRIFMKFDIWGLFSKICQEFKFY